MATNKHALIRFQTIDRCLSNKGRRYSFKELLEQVNEDLLEENPDGFGIKTRQLREDIRFMKSDSGYSAPIIANSDGGNWYYSYEDKNFSIYNSPLNETEAEQLRNAISVLSRFEGSPEFEWINELGPMLKDQFGLQDSSRKVMSYETNIDYTGYEHIKTFFNAIINKRVLKITYKPFNKDSFQLDFHPYFLKQYNNRWFVYGRNDLLDIDDWNMSLDRIIEISESNKKYKKDNTDWEEYFSDFIGATKVDEKLCEVKLEFEKEQAPYILTKPLHETQRIKELEGGRLEVRISVIPNYELETKILSFGEKVKVVKPIELKNRILNRIKKASLNY